MPIFGSGEQRILYFFYNLFIYLSDFFKRFLGCQWEHFQKFFLGSRVWGSKPLNMASEGLGEMFEGDFEDT